jgi:uncharacterized Zn finger protein
VRGYRYFARGRVDLAGVSAAGLDAEVKGKRVQHVRLRVQDGRLASGCSCAPKVLGPAACRHVWATLLEIDRQGALDGLRSSQRALALTALDVPLPKRKRVAADDATPSTTTKPAKSAKPRARVRGRT